MTVPLQLGGIVALLGEYGQLIAVGGWCIYQMYWPLWDTKLQVWFGSIHTRLIAIETVQIALAKVITPINEEYVKEIHDHDDLSPNDIIESDQDNTVVSDEFIKDE